MIIRGRPGITSARLVRKLSTSSITPGRYPDTRPMVTATNVATAPATSPTRSETRAPYTTWANTSLPLPVVPNQLLDDGFSYGVKLVDVGECVAITGARIAIR